MAYINAQLPAGIYANGTDWQASGRYHDGNLVRFHEGQIKPIGGWRRLSQTPVEGKAREIVSWRDNTGGLRAGIGTESHLYTMSQSGVLTDITPNGFTAGRADASNAGGYGAGVYGAGIYGQPIVVADTLLDASVWSLDLWGENLVGVMAEDGNIYEWTPPTGLAVPIANAPTAKALLVTEQRIMVALGADSNPRLVKWSDQENNTVWTTTATNYAGEFEIQTAGKIQTGVKLPEGALIFTDTDLHTMEFVGQPFVWTFRRVSDGSGAISQNSVVEIDGQVIWMGPQAFWQFNGFPQPLPCDVSDLVFTNLNRSQISKVTAFHNSQFGEIFWFYPDQTSTENNRYVVYSYREGHWTSGALTRLSAADMSPFRFPLMAGDDGHIYEHEVGFNHEGAAAFLKGGPLQLGEGDNITEIHEYLPDTNTLGDMTLTICSKYYPMDEEMITGPINAAVRTDLRISGRQHEIRFDMTPNTDWRIGVPRFDVMAGGER